MNFKRVCVLCERHNILKVVEPQRSLQIGPLGSLLKENLRNEWFFNNVINSTVPMFVNENKLTDTFKYAKRTCRGKLPFGITETFDGGSKITHSVRSTDENFADFGNLLVDGKCVGFRSYIVVNSSESMLDFHSWCKQRKAWWSKFSSSPGRYVLTDVQSDSDDNCSVEIRAKYPWGEQLLEKLNLHVAQPDGLCIDINESISISESKTMSSEILLSTMLLNFVCDAYEEADPKKQEHPVLRFHRKIAPYKIACVISSTEKSKELEQLAVYLCKILRNKGIMCAFLPSAPEDKWNVYDQIGVPYSLVLRDSSLKDGIVFLRNRDTTLEEQVHVTNLHSYVPNLFQNY